MSDPEHDPGHGPEHDPGHDLGRDAGRRRLLHAVLHRWPAGVSARCVCVGDDLAIVYADPGARLAPPWQRSPVDGSWRLRACDLPPGGGAGGGLGGDALPAHAPLLAPLGRLHDHDVLVDLGAAPGVVALAGDPDRARALALRVARHVLIADPRIAVVLVGRGVHGPWGRRAPTLLPDLSALLAADPDPGPTAADRLGLTGLVTEDRPVDAGGGHRLVVITDAPTTEQSSDLARLAARRRRDTTVLVAADPAHARWRLLLDAEGTVTMPLLGLRATTVRPAARSTPRSTGPHDTHRVVASPRRPPHDVLAALCRGPVPAAPGRR